MLKLLYLSWIVLFMFMCAFFVIVYHCYGDTEVTKYFNSRPARIEGNGQDSMFLQVDEKEKFDEGYTNITDPEFLEYLRKHWILSPSRLSQQFRNPPSNFDYSQIGQSKLVDELLSQRQNGFFVESGAANGYDLSNTVFFEMKRNWTGILIEPNPLLFKEMITIHRHAYLLNSCINTRNITSRLEFIPDIFDSGLKGQSQTNQAKPSVTVQCFPLLSIISALHNPNIDYLSLDVEGPELDILSTISFNEIFIDIIGVEYRVMGPQKNILPINSANKLKEVREFFHRTGLYKEVAILPAGSSEEMGIDVLFQRINVTQHN